MSGVPECQDESAAGTPLHPIVLRGALGTATGLLLHIVVGALRASPGEPASLRWLRVLADHPVRASIAAILALGALAKFSKRGSSP